MKTLTFKALLIIGLMVGSATMVNAAQAIKTNPNANAYYIFYSHLLDRALIQESTENPLVLNTTNKAEAELIKKETEIEEGYIKNRYALYQSATAIHIEKYKIQQLKLQLKQAKLNRNKLLVQQTRLELEKAQLNLFKNELHFIIDKEALRQNHLLAIKEKKQVLATHRAEVNKLRFKTIKQWITYDDKGLKKSKDLIALKKEEIKTDKLAIADEKKWLQAEMLAADKLVK